ncbi:hypothetical protein SUGI_0290400 [Cryptomeria japonica]|uniref:disease resistance protein RPV1 n=1 Tax=Cryptomeria japonica TaxID=3369 RepID=UPI002408B981|nr:disease resistance protein RPV1 [Cryptomeria japonica]GLJ16848.1 hypothetical protein SUGI_0290400 [Cryptomeria japonica]
MAGRNEITKSAFADILAPSVSASSSTPTKSVRYDVFINHRGPDSKQTLAASIYHALKLMGLEVFLDEPELDLGDSIPSEIQHAIATSFLHIAILSPRYAESTWCLEELSLMFKTGQTIIPVFYNVDVNDIRWIKGRYAQEFSKFEAKNRYCPEKVEDWKSALQKVSYLKGHIVNREDDEGMLKTIENYIHKHSKKIPFLVAKHPVGLDEILRDFKRSVMESYQNVKIVGIIGMGGCGKTTLAKEYYNEKMQSFYRCSFVCLDKDVATKNLYEKQKKMFQDLGGSKDISFDNVEEGKAILAEYLRFIQVFIILDDVDHLDQLESLLPIKDSLESGSVIVVTNRDSHILTSWGIPSNSIYKMKELDSEHALELFCWHAFLQPYPKDGFECLVNKFLKFCQGLPLSLKVLGGLVHGKSKDFWDSQLDKVSRSLPKDIKSIIKVSFDALDEEEEGIFLDISCFFIGTEKDSAITVWDESKWSGECSLQTLVDKCLVEVDEKNCLAMHDLLRDFGRDISKTRSPYRLWSPEQITHIEKQGKGSILIRGIKAQTDEFYEEFVEFVRESGKGIKRKRGLKILDVENNNFTEELATLSEGLVSLRWAKFPHRALPSWISLKKLRVLELREASKLEEPWSDTVDPPEQLRVLKIIHAGSFLRFPRSIGFLKDLKKISFDSYGAPIEGLPEEFGSLQSLECLELRGCHKLRSLPSKFGDLRNLQRLLLEECSGIESLPDEFGHLQSLDYLELQGCHKLKSLPSKIGDLINLQVLYLRECSGIEGLPEELCRLQSLQCVELVGCHNLKSLPSKIGDLTNMWRLTLKECSGIEGLPEEFGRLESLEYLELQGCHMLKSLSSKFGHLENLQNLQLWECNQLKIPSETLAQLASLQFLRIERCPGLTELVIQPGCFSSSLCSLEILSLDDCDVSRISISPQCCPSLESLVLWENHDLIEIDSLPISVKTVNVVRCSNLQSLSLNPGLVKLEDLHMRECGELKKIQGFENCSSLKTLMVHTWGEVPVIENLKDMESLRRLSLTAACHISAFESCLQSLNREKWPSECVICATTQPGVEAMVKCFSFPGLTLADSFDRQKTDRGSWQYVFSEKRPANAAAMICLVILNSHHVCITVNVTCLRPLNAYTGMPIITCTYLKEGKWVYIGVFNPSSLVGSEVPFSLSQFACDPLEDDLIEMGILAMGEENSVVGAFHELVQQLGKLGNISEFQSQVCKLE